MAAIRLIDRRVRYYILPFSMSLDHQSCWPLKLTILIPVLLSVANLGAGADEKYLIKLEYPSKTGQKYHLRAHGYNKEQSVITTSGKTNTQAKEIVIELDGEIEVLDVDSKGHERKIACTVEKCIAGNGREKKPLFKKGDVFVLQDENGRKTFFQEGVEVALQAAAALHIVLSIHKAATDDDDIFGTKDLKKIGESWPINPSAAMAEFKTPGTPFVPRDLEGSTRLAGVSTLKGERYLDISSTMKAGIEPPSRPGIKVRDAMMELQCSGPLLYQQFPQTCEGISPPKSGAKNGQGNTGGDERVGAFVRKGCRKRVR
jgi:hypothetical protein